MLARAAAAAARRLSPLSRGVQHLAPSGEWLALDSSAALDADAVTVHVGLGGEALDAIGDVRAIRWTAQPGAAHAANAALAELDWEGFTVRARGAAVVARWHVAPCACAGPRADAFPAQRTASDELYHAVWKNTTGVRPVSSPLPGHVVAVNRDLAPGQLDETTWLARLRVRRSAWDAATASWRAEADRRRAERQ